MIVGSVQKHTEKYQEMEKRVLAFSQPLVLSAVEARVTPNYSTLLNLFIIAHTHGHTHKMGACFGVEHSQIEEEHRTGIWTRSLCPPPVPPAFHILCLNVCTQVLSLFLAHPIHPCLQPGLMLCLPSVGGVSLGTCSWAGDS